MTDHLNPAQKRIWDDDAQLAEVDLSAAPNESAVRLSTEALEVLRDHGTETYEAYIAGQTQT